MRWKPGGESLPKHNSGDRQKIVRINANLIYMSREARSLIGRELQREPEQRRC